MSKKVNNQQEDFATETTSKIEKFFAKHGIKVVIALAVVLVGVGGWFIWDYIQNKKEMAAKEAIWTKQANLSVETPDNQLVIDGFLSIVKNHEGTKAANIANHYLGIQYLRIGDLENANKYLKAYEAVEGSIYAEIINAQNIGLQGDVAVEQGDYAAAAQLFQKAVSASGNSFTAPYYLYKQALALEATGDVEGAKACYKTISEKYPESVEFTKAEDRL